MTQNDVLKLRNLLDSEGVERTPSEVEEIVCHVKSLYETVDEEAYNFFKKMTPGGILITAWKENETVENMMTIRDIIMYVYENKIGIKNPSFSHRLASYEEI